MLKRIGTLMLLMAVLVSTTGFARKRATFSGINKTVSGQYGDPDNLQVGTIHGGYTDVVYLEALDEYSNPMVWPGVPTMTYNATNTGQTLATDCSLSGGTVCALTVGPAGAGNGETASYSWATYGSVNSIGFGVCRNMSNNYNPCF